MNTHSHHIHHDNTQSHHIHHDHAQSHHPHHDHAHINTPDGHKKIRENFFMLAVSATLHCLLGCGLGEVSGMVIGTWLNMNNINTTILALALGWFFGLLLGMLPLLRAGFQFRAALKQVLIAEGLSIAVMEAVEIAVQFNTPGVMDAHLTDWLFWKGMLLGLGAGFIAALPINYVFVKKGIRHVH